MPRRSAQNCAVRARLRETPTPSPTWGHPPRSSRRCCRRWLRVIAGRPDPLGGPVAQPSGVPGVDHLLDRHAAGRGPLASVGLPVQLSGRVRIGVDGNLAPGLDGEPERLDPPKRLLRLAVEAGCKVAINTDAHAPGQLDWQPYGCERAAACGVPIEQVINARDAARRSSGTAERVRPPSDDPEPPPTAAP